MLYGCDWIIFQLISEIFIQIIKLSCATNVFIAGKFSVIMFFVFLNHKKRKVSLVRLLSAAELEFPKVLVPRLPQNTSNVNIESTGKSKQLYFYVTNFLGL